MEGQRGHFERESAAIKSVSCFPAEKILTQLILTRSKSPARTKFNRRGVVKLPDPIVSRVKKLSTKLVITYASPDDIFYL